MQQQTPLSKQDQTYYFRQLCAYGEHYMSKITDLKIYIHGLQGLGAEVAKCLILSGVKHLTIQDDNLLEMKDLGSNAYCREEDVGKKTRAVASIDLLKALNPRVSVQVNEFEVTERLLTDHHVVIFTDYYDKKKLISFNKFCRTREIGFIYGGVLGLYGFVFVDFGENFVINEENIEEEPEKFFIENIRKVGSDYLEIKVEEDEGCKFKEGDYVRFQEVEGMTQLNGQVHQLHSWDYLKFTIRCDTTIYGNYLYNGYIVQEKRPQKLRSNDLETSLNFFEGTDPSKFGQSEKLHKSLKGILDFYGIYQRLPELHNEKDAQEYYSFFCQAHYLKDESLRSNIARYARVQLSSHCSFFGGMIAQETLKLTGKFMPLKQWFHYETFEMIPQGITENPPKETRYDNQIAIFGQEFQKNLENQKVLLIGVGTLGCELMKQFALMGIGCGEKGKVTCVDSGTVKPSNLSRQSLYKEKDIGRSKCQVACEAILNINPHMKVESKKVRIGSSEEKTWKCDEFWEDYDIVFCAVDNLTTREKIDRKCVLYQKPMLECEMNGTEASTQIIIPFKSQTYEESNDCLEYIRIPHYKLRFFPSKMKDCAIWMRNSFEKKFCEPTESFLDFQKNPQVFIEHMKKDMAGYVGRFPYELQNVQRFAQAPSIITQEICLQYAAQTFDDFFCDDLKKLLVHYPPDYKELDGRRFWNSKRKYPQPFVLDAEDEAHASFILLAANIYAKMFNLPPLTDKFAAALQAKNLPPLIVQEEASASEFIKILESRDLSSFPTVKRIEYNRDNKLYADFIVAASILRGRNFFVPEIPEYKIKMMAGQFSAALMTTATTITGALSFENFKLNFTNDITLMRNTYLNLEVPSHVVSEPLEPKKTTDKEYDPIFMGPAKVFPVEFTAWDTLDIQGPLTVLEIVQYFMKKYGLRLTCLNFSGTVLYTTMPYFERDGEINSSAVVPEEALIRKGHKKEELEYSKYLMLSISTGGETDDDVDFLTPPIRYIRK